MKIKIIILLLFSNSIFGQQIASSKNIKLESKILNQERELLIYTPQSYEENTLVYYDVIYVFDAQNREFFDFTSSIISFISNTTKKYIIVGITSPYIAEIEYTRNNDLLPILETEESKKRYGKYSGNADNFLKYVKDEVVPFIENNYRTRSNKLAIGHSLSASFIIYSLFKEPNLFNEYFAISPNLAYDNERLAKEFTEFDYQKIKKKKFFYVSNANEGVDYWQEWTRAREKVYSFLENSTNSDKINSVIKSYPNETHWSTFAPSLTFGLTEYLKYLENNPITFSNETYEITINLKVPNKNDEVYVSGNQESLGNWNPSLIKMKHKSDTMREIKVKIKNPTELKFTRGSWETQGLVKNNEGFNNIMINPKKRKEFEFEIIKWSDNME